MEAEFIQNTDVADDHSNIQTIFIADDDSINDLYLLLLSEKSNKMHEVYDFQTTPNTVSVMFTFVVAVDDEADPTNRNQKAGLVYIQDGVEDQNKIDKNDLEGMQTVEQLRKHIADRLELENFLC